MTPKEILGVKQQKCLFHIGRLVAAVLQTKVWVTRRFGVQLLDLLDDALVHLTHAAR